MRFDMIDVNNIDFDSILSDLIKYVSTLPEGKRLTDFFEGGTSMTILEVCSGLATYGVYHGIVTRREANILTAKIRKYIENSAASKGYSINRRQSASFDIKFTPQITTIWDKKVPIGTVPGYNVVFEKDEELVYGKEVTARVTVGDWTEFVFPKIELQSVYDEFIVPGSLMDNDIDHILFKVKNGDVTTILEIVKEAKDLLYNSSKKILMKTYYDGVVFLHGNGLQGYKFKPGDESHVEYVESKPYFPDSISQVKKEFELKIKHDGEVEISNLYRGSERDSIEKIKHLALAYVNSHATMVTPQDWRRLPATYTGVYDANYFVKRKTNERVKVTYVLSKNIGVPKKTYIMNDYEKQEFIKYMRTKTLAEELIDVQDPRRIGIECEMIVYVKEIVKQEELEKTIKDIFDSLTYRMEQQFNVKLVEEAIYKLNNVTRMALIKPTIDKALEYDQFLGLDSLALTIEIDKGQLLKVEPKKGGYVEDF